MGGEAADWLCYSCLKCCYLVSREGLTVVATFIEILIATLFMLTK